MKERQQKKHQLLTQEDVDGPHSAEVRAGKGETQEEENRDVPHSGNGLRVDRQSSGKVNGGKGQTPSRKRLRRLQRLDSQADSPPVSVPNPCYSKSVSCPAESPAAVSRRMKRRLQRHATMEEKRSLMRQPSQSSWSPGAQQHSIVSTQQFSSVPCVLSPLPSLLENGTTQEPALGSTTSSVAMTTLQESPAMTSPSSPGAAVLPVSLAPAEQTNAEDSS